MGELDDITLDDIPPTSATVKIPIEAGRIFADKICKRCNHRAGNHQTVPLENGSKCTGSDGNGCNRSCSGFIE